MVTRRALDWTRAAVRTPAAIGLALVLVALAGAWLGLLFGGEVQTRIGPVQARMSLEPSLTGQTVVNVSPLGSLDLGTHQGPLRLNVDVWRLNVQDARALFNSSDALNHLQDQVVHDVRVAIAELALRGTVVAVAGSGLLALAVFRRRHEALLASGLALAVMITGAGTAALTFDPKSVLEPRYTGLLSSAPTLVGNVQDIVSRFQSYRQELAKLVTNVSGLYDVTSTLPAYEPDPSTLRVLNVSDIHLNPAAWNVIRSVIKQFHIDFVVDCGDLTDHGSAPEDRFADEIATLGVPYVFVRGNHDSAGTQAAVARQKNAIVLTDTVATVDGMRLIGDGDPRFTPDMSVQQSGEDQVRVMGENLGILARRAKPPADIAVVHDPEAAPPLDGSVKLVLAGHVHRRQTSVMPAGTRLFVQGSTGGAGLRALETKPPTPLELSVLYFDRRDRSLKAWDDITLGGLGLTSAQITRRLAAEPNPATGSSPAPEPR